MPAVIVGIDYYLPVRVETNEDLQRENPDWQMDRIYSKSGIASRHIAADGQTASDMGYEAAQKLLNRLAVDPKKIDFLLYCTQSPDYCLPSAACILQRRLNLPTSAGAFDFNLGCSGYIYGLHMAKSFIESGAASNVLLITSDTYTRYIHRRDRTVRTLFGDGAAATLISRDDHEGIGHFVLGTDGAGANNLIVPCSGLKVPRSPQSAQEATDAAGCVRSAQNLFMDGPAIFTFAITTVPKTISDLLGASNLSADAIDWYVYHQANKYMLDNLAARSKVPPAKMMVSMEDIGNTVSSSIPIALSRYVEAGKVASGQKLMMIGFGVGYSWGATIVTWK